LDTWGKDEITAVAATIEATGYPGKIFGAVSADSDVLVSTASNVLLTMQALAYEKTYFVWSEVPHAGVSEGWMSLMFSQFDPGNATWAYQTPVGVPPTVFGSTERTAITDGGGNYYYTQNSQNVTREGLLVGGDYIDNTRFIAWVVARIQEAIFSRMAALPKISMTDGGAAIIYNEINGVLALGVANKGIAPGEYSIFVPRIADVPINDRASRILSGVTFEFRLAGAVHTVIIRGTVTV
jgi:hypothetical protein